MVDASSPKISVVVPVYNAGATLDRCVKSILEQTYANLELILVNDGSADDSGRRCEMHAAADRRVKVYHKENGGVSSARNMGLQNSSGDWVTFVDSDDWVEKGWLEACVSSMSENEGIDIIRTGYYNDYPDRRERVSAESSFEISSKDDMLSVCEDIAYYAMVWNTVFRREIVEEVRFNESLSWSEDYIFSYDAYLRCRKMLILSDAFYHYQQTEGGLSNIKDPFKMKAALDAGLEAKMKLISGGEILKRAFDKYHGFIKVAISRLYSGNWNYQQRRQFAEDLHVRQHATRMEKFLLTDMIPFCIKDVALRLGYRMKNLMVR